MLALTAQESVASGLPWYWYVIGFSGQAAFASRFYIQWLASERARRSVIPKVFWHLSLFGSLVLLVYAIRITDPVFISGQAMGFLVYSRNLYFIRISGQDTEVASKHGPTKPTVGKPVD